MRAIPLPAGVVPIGATHFFFNPQRKKPSTDVWRKREDGKWFMFMDDKRQWQQIGAKSAHMFVPIERALYDRPEVVPVAISSNEGSASLEQRIADLYSPPASEPAKTNWRNSFMDMPLAGDEIEFDRGGKDWIKVTVFAVEAGIDESSDVLFRHAEGWGFIDSASERIRPYVSPEEVARRERSAYLERMYKIVLDRDESKDAVEALYDAGLRFQEEA